MITALPPSPEKSHNFCASEHLSGVPPDWRTFFFSILLTPQDKLGGKHCLTFWGSFRGVSHPSQSTAHTGQNTYVGLCMVSFSYMPALLPSLETSHSLTYSPLCPQLGTDTQQIVSECGFHWTKEWTNDWTNKLVKNLSWFEVKRISLRFSHTCHLWSCSIGNLNSVLTLHSPACCSSQGRLDSSAVTNVPKFSLTWHNNVTLATCWLWFSDGLYSL